jgi:polysaccharide pyruvyl transferase CsaB
MKFLICGYYGFGNAGDELLLSATIRLLNNSHPEAEICVLSKNPDETFRSHGVVAAYRYNPVAVLWEVLKSDRVIIGGGGLLQDFTGPFTLYYYLAIALLGLVCRRQTVFHAIGANALNRFNSNICRLIMGHCAVISVRDQKSLELLAQWGLPPQKLALTADPVFSDLPEAVYQPQAQPVVLMVLRHNSNIARLLPAIAGLMQITGAKVVALPFQPSKDGGVAISLSRASKEVVELGLWHDLQSLLCQFDQCCLVISERYHALALAALRGLPAICISDDDKLIRFARQFDCPVLRPSDNFDPAALNGVAERLWKYRDILKPALLRKSAAQNILANLNPALT